jgi:hypothetical protein
MKPFLQTGDRGGTNYMNWWEFGSNSTEENDQPEKERRKEPRIGAQFKVRYSGSDEGKIVMSHARIVDLSRHRFGLQRGPDLQLGMELALF